MNSNKGRLAGKNTPMNSIAIVSPDGACADICPYGAHVISWKPAAGTEQLFLSTSSVFSPGVPIRGGVPVIFPQFGDQGQLRKHGFARVCLWEAFQEETGATHAAVKLKLSDSGATRQLWPHAFQAEMHVRVSANRLELAFSVANAGSEDLSFTAALHTYLRVSDIQVTTVDGLAGIRYHDTTTTPWAEKIEEDSKIRLETEVDRIYYGVRNAVQVRTPERVTRIEAEGFPDVVLWNPGRIKSNALSDMEQDGYRRFVCVEAAMIEKPVCLASGNRWCGKQTLAAEPGV